MHVWLPRQPHRHERCSMETANTVVEQTLTMPKQGDQKEATATPHIAVQVMEGITFSVLLVLFSAIYAQLLSTMIR